MKIKYIRAKNFLSIGETPVEIDFSKYGNIINIKGENLDVGEGASNGSGKTTIVEIIVYALFGKLIKGLSHKEAINIKNKKGLEVEILFDKYRIVRKRKPDELHLWESEQNIWNKETEISLGGGPATQDEIQRRIKLSYNAFINIVCFGQHNANAFLSCEPKDKREIAENLLSLDKYVKYGKIAKDKEKKLEEKIETLSAVYDKALQDYNTNEKQNQQVLSQQERWIINHQQDINALSVKLEKTKTKLSAMRDGDALLLYQKQQKELETIDEQMEKEGSRIQKVKNAIREAQEKVYSIKDDRQNVLAETKENVFSMKRLEQGINDSKKKISDLVNKTGTTCPVCYAEVSPENYHSVVEHHEQDIKNKTHEIKQLLGLDKDYKDKIVKIEQNISTINNLLDNFLNEETTVTFRIRDLSKRKQELLKIVRPSADSEALLLQQEIVHLDTQLKNKLIEEDPYKSIIETNKENLQSSKSKLQSYKEDINNLNSQLPYIRFWIKAFGDNGIRAFVIDEVIPILNNRINYWLQFLIDNKIKLAFNNQLEETIERNPSDSDPFVYNAMSGGEKKKIDLAICLSFSHCMAMIAGRVPSLMFFDEIATNMDRDGVLSVYNVICELAHGQGIQTLIITHDETLQELLSQEDTILIRKRDGFSVKV